MKRIVIACAVVLSVLAVDAAQFRYVKTVADVTVADTAAAVFSSTDVLAGSGHVQATLATCTLTTANIRVTVDGTTPTTNLGQVLTPGAWTFSGTDTLLNLQAIRDDSTSATLACILYGE